MSMDTNMIIKYMQIHFSICFLIFFNMVVMFICRKEKKEKKDCKSIMGINTRGC